MQAYWPLAELICYLLNKYNANKTVEFEKDNIHRFLVPQTKVTIEILHDPDGPLNAPDEEKGWFDRWDGHWGEVKRETKILNLTEVKKFTYTIPPLSFVSFKFVDNQRKECVPYRRGSPSFGIDGHYSGMIWLSGVAFKKCY